MGSRFCPLVLIISVLAARSSVAETGGSVHWRYDFAQAVAEASSTGKLLLVNIHTTWCLPCKQLQRTTLRDPNLAALIHRHCVPVSLDGDREAALIEQWGVRGFPTQVFLTADGRKIGQIVGYTDVSQYTMALLRAVESQGPAGAPALANGPVNRPPATPAPFAGGDPARTASSFATRTPNAMPAPPPVTTWAKQSEPAGTPAPGLRPPAPPASATSVAASQPLNPSALSASTNRAQPCDSSMPIALDGFCPVSMIKQASLLRGSEVNCLTYKGRRYLLRSNEDRTVFETDPERYLPGEEGMCVVSLVDKRERRPGYVQYPALFGDHVFFFSNDSNRRLFLQDPDRYVDEPSGRAKTDPVANASQDLQYR